MSSRGQTCFLCRLVTLTIDQRLNSRPHVTGNAFKSNRIPNRILNAVSKQGPDLRGRITARRRWAVLEAVASYSTCPQSSFIAMV